MWSRAREDSVESTIRRLKDQASFALGKRKYQKAVELFLALTHAEPDEPTHRVRLGDIYVRTGGADAAIEFYRAAMELYERQYAYRKAAAVAALILQIDAEDLDAYRMLNQWRGFSAKPPPPPPAPVPEVKMTPPPPLKPAAYNLSDDEDEEGVFVSVEPSPVAMPSVTPASPRPPPPASGAEPASAASGWGSLDATDIEWDAITQLMMPRPVFPDSVNPSNDG